MAKTKQIVAERSRESVRRWYAAHREEYSALRKKRYRADAARREKARKNAARYRKARAKGLTIQRVLTRELGGVHVPVYTLGYVSDRVGVSPPVLRTWQAKGWLPAPLFKESRHRLYTKRQVELVRLLADTIKAQSKIGISRTTKQLVIDEVVGVIHKTWKVSDACKDGQKTRRRSRVSRKK